MDSSLYRYWLVQLSRGACRWLAGPSTPVINRRRVRRVDCWPAIEQLDVRIVPARVLVPVVDPSNLIFDATRNILYLPADGKIERWDVASQTLLTPFNVGGSLEAGDITPDGHYLYVANRARVNGKAIVFKIDLTTGASTSLIVDSLGGTIGPIDVKIAANGTGFVTMTADGSSDVNLWQFDLATDTFAVRGRVWENTWMARSADRSLIAFECDSISTGPLQTYSSATDSFIGAIGTGPYAQFSNQVNRNGTLVSYAKGGQDIKIYDSTLHEIIELSTLGVDGSHAFDPIRDILYAFKSDTDEIIAIDTNTWLELFRMPFESNINTYGLFLVSADGSHLFYTRGESDNYQFDIPAPLTVKIASVSVNEGNSGGGTAQVTVTLSVPSATSVTVDYSTSPGTATTGVDFNSVSGTVTFPPNQTTQTISIPIIGDADWEADETFFVNLSNPINVFISQGQAQVTIVNDDSGVPPSLTGLAPSVTFPENAVNLLIDSDVTFTDPDTPSLNGGNMSVSITSGGGVEDAFGIQNQGTGAGQIGVSGTTLTYGGVPFATFISGSSLTVNFTTNQATPAAIEALIEHITYSNMSDAPNPSRVISVLVTDGFGTPSLEATSTISVTAENDPPFISTITDRSSAEDTQVVVPFTIGDDETAVASLVVSVTSSNQLLVPDDRILISGLDANRTVSLTPLADQSGTSTITVTVDDGGLQSFRTFLVTITAVNDPPTISDVSDQSTTEDTATPAFDFTVGDVETPPANLIVTATSSNVGLVPNANVVLVGNGANRTVQATPLANQSGVTTITLTVSDGSATSIDTFDLTVDPINDPPTISNVADLNTNEDTATAPLAFTIGDIDSAINGLTVTATSSNPALVPDANLVLGGSSGSRTVKVVPFADQSGTVTVTLTVSDGFLTAQDTFTVTVVPVNDAPTITHVNNLTVNEDVATSALGFMIGDIDTSVGSLIVTATSSNTVLVPNGNLLVSGSGINRTITVTPFANASGSTTITITVNDGSATSVDSFVLTVSPVNDPPTISDIPDQTISEDHSLTPVAFTVGDVDTLVGSLQVSVTSSNPALVSTGNITLGGGGANRTVSLVPSPNQSGTAVITVTVSDGVLTKSDAFTLTVNAINDAPTVTGLAGQTINEDTPTAALAFTIGDAETPLSSLVVSASSSNPALIPDGNLLVTGSGAGRAITATPAANQSGSATITVSVSDGLITTSTSFLVTVLSVNDSPGISDISNLSTNEDNATSVIPVTLSDVDSPLGNLTLTATSSNMALVPNSKIVLAGSGANRTVQITPSANQSGSTTITLTVSDGFLTASDTFDLIVNPVNDAPTISQITNRNTNESTATPPLAFTIGDVDSSLSGLNVTATSSNPALVPDGNLVLSGSGASRTVQVIPLGAEFGDVSVTLTVSDGALTTSMVFTVTVVRVDDAPTISSLNDQTIQEDSSTGMLGFTIDDLDTPAGSLVVTATSSNTAVIPNGNLVLSGSGTNRTIAVTPAANAFGDVTVTVSVSDGTTAVVRAFLVSVLPVDDAPTISDISNQSINEDQTLPAVVFVVDDAETLATNLSISVTSSNPALVSNDSLVLGGSGANRTLTATPMSNQSGTTVITVSVDDGLTTRSDTFTLTVNAINDAPSITALTAQTINEDAPTAALAFTIGDVETSLNSLVITTSSSNQSLIPNGNLVVTGNGAGRAITVTPAANQSGSATITVSVSDGLITTSTSFLVTVLSINDSPSISDVSDQFTDEDNGTPPISFVLNDVDSPLGNLTVTAVSSNAALVPNSNIALAGSGANRTVQVRPAANQSGMTTITLTVSDGAAIVSKTFLLTVNAVNDAPVIGGLGDLLIQEDAATAPLFFSVSDGESAAGSLIVSATSSNPALVPDTNLVLDGTGADRSIVIVPLANQFGSTTITISVNDGILASSQTFVLTVSGVNDAPFISEISSQTINEDQPTAAIPITIGDIETLTENLVVTVSSSNSALVPFSNVVINGSASRTITVTPAADASGLAVITVSVSDGQLTRSTFFSVIVMSVNDAPTFTLGANQMGPGDTSTVVLPHWVSNISAGPADEASQTLSFLVSTDRPELFATQPDINLAGDLTYRLIPNAAGQAVVTVSLRDEGGTANGGSNVSATETFTITAIDDPLIIPASEAVRQFVMGSQPVAIDPSLSARDIDNPNTDFSQGQLTVAISGGGGKADRLSLPLTKKNKPSASDVGLVGTNVLYHNQQIATLQGGRKGVPLHFQFGTGATEAAVNALLKALNFRTAGKQPADSIRTIRIELRDAANVEHAETTRAIQVLP